MGLSLLESTNLVVRKPRPHGETTWRCCNNSSQGLSQHQQQRAAAEPSPLRPWTLQGTVKPSLSEPWSMSQLVQTIPNKRRLCSVTKPRGNLSLSKRQPLCCPIWMLTLPPFTFPAQPSALISGSVCLAAYLSFPLGFRVASLTSAKSKLISPHL